MPARALRGLCPHCRLDGQLNGHVCAACWAYQRRTGALPGPAAIARRVALRTAAAVGRCGTCGVATRPQQRVRGRCEPCARYWRYWGTERPAARWGEELRRPRPSVTIPTAESGCPDCGTEHGLRADGLCRACAISRELGA